MRNFNISNFGQCPRNGQFRCILRAPWASVEDRRAILPKIENTSRRWGTVVGVGRYPSLRAIATTLITSRWREPGQLFGQNPPPSVSVRKLAPTRPGTRRWLRTRLLLQESSPGNRQFTGNFRYNFIDTRIDRWPLPLIRGSLAAGPEDRLRRTRDSKGRNRAPIILIATA